MFPIFYFRIILPVVGGHFYVYNLPISIMIWTHVVLNYFGPEEGTQGIRVYLDGELEATDTWKSGNPKEPGDGRLVVGRLYSDIDDTYASVGADELLLFNQKLDDQEIMSLKNIIWPGDPRINLESCSSQDFIGGSRISQELIAYWKLSQIISATTIYSSHILNK